MATTKAHIPPLAQSLFVAYGLKKTGDPTVEKSPDALDHTGIVIGSSTDMSRKKGEDDTGKTVFYHTVAGDDGTGDGTSGNPYKTYGKAATDIDDVTKTWVEQMDVADLDLSAEGTIVPVQAALGTVSELVALPNLSAPTFVEVETGAAFHDVAFGAGVWVAIEANNPSEILRSTDSGVTWSTVSLPTSAQFTAPTSVNYSNGVWLIVGGQNDPRIFRSSDNGLTWAVSDQEAGFDAIFDVFEGNGVWYAVGQESGTGGPLAQISTDNGLTFEKVSLPSVNVTTLRHGAFGNGVTFITYGSLSPAQIANEVGFYSLDDGATWNALAYSSLNLSVASVTGRGIQALTFGDGIFMAVGGVISDSFTEVTTAADAQTWTKQAGTIGVPQVLSVAFGADWFVVTVSGNTANKAYLSNNSGASFSTSTLPWVGSSAGRGIDFGEGFFIWAGTGAGSGRIVKSNQQSSIKGLAGFDVNLDHFGHDGDQVNCTFNGQTSWASAGGSFDRCKGVAAFVKGDGNFLDSDFDPDSQLVALAIVDGTYTNSKFGNMNITGNATLTDVKAQPAAGRALIGTEITADQCLFESQDDEAINIDSPVYRFTNVLAITRNIEKRAATFKGIAAAAGDAITEFIGCIGDLFFDNVGGTGLERFQNSWVIGDAEATELVTPMKVQNCNVFNGAIVIPGLIADVGEFFQVDPVFIDALTYRLQRESGYVDTPDFDFDSPIIRKALDFEDAVESHTTSSGQIRDIGPWSHDDTDVKVDFRFSHYFPRPAGENPLGESDIVTAKLLPGDNGKIDVYNNVAKQSQKIVISWENLHADHVAKIRHIESFENMEVFLALFPENGYELPEITANGAQPAGQFHVDINPAVLSSGAILTIGGKEYRVLYIDPNTVAATAAILDRKLESSVIDTEPIQQDFPVGLGRYLFLPTTRNMPRDLYNEVDFKKGASLTFFRDNL